MSDHQAQQQAYMAQLLAVLKFTQPHPLGLPSHFSHPVKELGKGAFGQVYLCFYHQPAASAAAQRAPSTEFARAMSVDDASASVVSAPSCSSVPSSSSSDVPPLDWQHLDWHNLPWVAVKVYKPLGQCDSRSLEYLKREVVNQRRLEHQHVISFKEVGITTDYRLYLALEYADSGNLKQWLAASSGRLSEDEARWFLQQLVYGLAYCHAHGVYNRDIKPENLLLHLQGGCLPRPLLKVADFGLSKSTHDSAPDSCVGTPHFMAPEVFVRRQYDGRKADVFSCGVVLFLMLTGRLPFAPSTRTNGAAQPGGGAAPADFRINLRAVMAAMEAEAWGNQVPAEVALSPECEDLLRGMLRFNPDTRLSLSQVKRHPWYSTGLAPEIYQMILDDGEVARGSSGGGGMTQQSVEGIEAEFDRIMAHCKRLHAEAAERILNDVYDG